MMEGPYIKPFLRSTLGSTIPSQLRENYYTLTNIIPLSTFKICRRLQYCTRENNLAGDIFFCDAHELHL